MTSETPALGWFHVTYDVTKHGVHIHVQEAHEYRGLRLVWTLNALTGERKTRFFIRANEFETLNEAIANWPKYKPKRKRVRLC